MAKKKDKRIVCFQSTESSCRYYGKRNEKDPKLTLRKFDKILRKHVIFQQTKLK